MKLEVFEDRMYFDQFAVRPEGSKSFNDTIHFVRKGELGRAGARGLREGV